ncbi:MAG: MoaD/ThiS family protein [Xanthomonadales bacterium]|nr:MoaD/ThiS family protein [Xanthomonadales bacterium]MCB1633348.1 MoaD/ThiS family protein [Xanthomonadales bacterium]MCB1640285.1 MoaD/ThiS family protein [Xanthomonadales bacterium]
MQVDVRYFAELSERAGSDQQRIQLTASTDAAALYARLQAEHGFRFPIQAMRVAVNGRLADWSQALDDGDEVCFLPPFSGG